MRCAHGVCGDEGEYVKGQQSARLSLSVQIGRLEQLVL